MDLSWPYLDNPDVSGDIPIAVNDGIDIQSYPTKMTSMESVLKLINMSGNTSFLVKQDWCDAYKHVLKEAFYNLPSTEKAEHLLSKEKLDERQIKQLHRLRIELPKDEKSSLLKEQIKKRLLTL